MKQIVIREYDLMISCPGDVQEYVAIIIDKVNEYNDTVGSNKGIRINVRHWSRSSYPDSGDDGQGIINRQITDKCDFCVAIFWTKFGSPTERFDSGTEEEIESMISSGRHVMLYFVDKVAKLSQVDLEQYNKVKAYQKKYKNTGLYWTVKDEQEFSEKFPYHLIRFIEDNFVNVAINNEENNDPVWSNPYDIVKRIDKNGYTSFLNSDFLRIKEHDINYEIQKINNIGHPTEMKGKLPEHLIKIVGSENRDLIESCTEPAVIEGRCKSIISTYCKNYGLCLDADFYDLGDLKFSKEIIQISTGRIYNGSEDAIRKYKLIQNLSVMIEELDQYNDYLGYFDHLSMVELGVLNDGREFDEDIDIKLYFSKDTIIKPNGLKRPGMLICADINDGKYKDIFTCDNSTDFKEYGDYPKEQNDIHQYGGGISLIDIRTETDRYKDELINYDKHINTLFCYDIKEHDEESIWSFNISYLKQHTGVRFPTKLYFEKLPKTIKYEITSKYMPDIVTGEIVVQ